jgi:transcriptional regulator with XRE-family HTH domain
MTSEIGRRIYEARLKSGLTQDQFGKKYNVSGPAVFKFEKDKVRPSLEVWLQMAKDAGLSERHSVLLWARERLPEDLRDYLDVQVLLKEDSEQYGKKNKYNYSAVKDQSKLRKLAQSDPMLPSALKDFLNDNELWALYKPTGSEIQTLKSKFTSLGFGSKELFREALRLVRDFGRS